MTPERAASLVSRWVRLYTRKLPPPIAGRRRGEIDADLHDHIAHERARGTDERRIAVGIATRMVRGMAADASWRGRTLARASTRKDLTKMHRPASRSALRIGLATALVVLLPLVAMQVSDDWNWGVFDFVFAAALVAGTGLLLELAARKGSGVVLRLGAAAIAVAAIVLGEADDAPGLVLFGLLVIAGTVALTIRRSLAR